MLGLDDWLVGTSSSRGTSQELIEPGPDKQVLWECMETCLFGPCCLVLTLYDCLHNVFIQHAWMNVFNSCMLHLFYTDWALFAVSVSIIICLFFFQTGPIHVQSMHALCAQQHICTQEYYNAPLFLWRQNFECTATNIAHWSRLHLIVNPKKYFFAVHWSWIAVECTPLWCDSD